MAFIMRVLDTVTLVPKVEMYIESGSVSGELDSSGSFSASIPVNTAAAAGVDEGDIVELYLDGELLIQAEVQSISRGVLESTKAIKMSGRDVLDTLYDVGPDPTLMVEDTPLLLALYTILEPCNWRLGDIWLT